MRIFLDNKVYYITKRFALQTSSAKRIVRRRRCFGEFFFHRCFDGKLCKFSRDDGFHSLIGGARWGHKNVTF